MESRYYSQTPEQVLAAVESREEGLTSRQAQERLERFGPNALREEKKKPVWQVFLEQFKDLLVVILIAAAVISMLSGNVESTIVIFAVLILNAVLGTCLLYTSGRLSGGRKGRPYIKKQIRIRSVSSAKPGAGVEPHHS